MLPKLKRLTKRDFIGIRPHIVFRGTYVDIALHPSSHTRFACIISKKRIKKAVDRNKVKRKIYNILTLITTKNQNLIFVYPKHSCISANHTLLRNEIEQVFATL